MLAGPQRGRRRISEPLAGNRNAPLFKPASPLARGFNAGNLKSPFAPPTYTC